MADFSSTLNVSQELEPEAVEDGDEDCVSTEQLVEKLEEVTISPLVAVSGSRDVSLIPNVNYDAIGVLPGSGVLQNASRI